MSVQSQVERFIEACRTGDLSSVQELLNTAADMDASRSISQIIHAQEDCALRWAAGNGHEAVCRLLLEHGADIRACDDFTLQWVAQDGHEAVCRLLIEHGANIHAESDYALRWAAQGGRESICQLLIEHGANIHAENDDAIQRAAMQGYEAVCQLLLELDPLMARHISPTYTEEVLRVFQAYGDHDAITEALMGFTDDENDYITSCFISRKSAV